MNDRTRKIVSFTDRQWRCFIGVIAIGILAGLVFLGSFPAVSSREASRPSVSKTNLKLIGLALHHYHEEYGYLPPALTMNDMGKAMHGWPAMLLPYLEETTLHSSINYENSYSDPANVSVMNADVQTYLNPMVDRPPGTVGEMHYTLNSHVFGPDTAIKFDEITDGTSNTFAGGEISTGFRPWSDPYHTRDPSLGFNAGPLTFGSPYFGTSKYHGVQMLMMDGSVHTFNDAISPSVLKALATPTAGDDPGSNWP